MLTLPDKAAVHRALRASLAAALETMVEAARDTARGATHEENRSEGDKDMRSTEQSYLARGQAMRAEELAETLARFNAERPVAFAADAPIAHGALVHIELDDEERVLFLVAQGGGTVLDVDGIRVTVVTPSSPMGAALLGKRPADDFEIHLRGTRREGAVLAVS